VAKLADAPDLGLRNHRFQGVAFRFNAERLYLGKTAFFAERTAVANGEQNSVRSSTNSSTQSRQIRISLSRRFEKSDVLPKGLRSLGDAVPHESKSNQLDSVIPGP
jgi:hypothetical protein